MWDDLQNLSSDSREIIGKSLIFTREIINRYFHAQMERSNISTIEFLERQHAQIIALPDHILEKKLSEKLFKDSSAESVEIMLNCISSSLFIYKLDLEKSKKQFNLSEIDVRIKNINNILDKFFCFYDKNNYIKYYDVTHGKKYDLFLSYSSKDNEIVEYFIDEIKNRVEFELFVAKKEENITKNWRISILNSIKDCEVYIPIVTPNFITSVWTNQEFGYALALEKKILPIFLCNEKPGFLESIHGIIVEDVSYVLMKNAANTLISKINDLLEVSRD